MDALSVSIALSFKFNKMTLRQSFRIALFFGAFQFFMPIAGFFAGAYVETIVQTYDHWVAFALLSAVGIKMIWDSFKRGEDDTDNLEKDPTKGWTLLVLSVATSIDAVAVGFSFGMLKSSILFPSAIIGIVCFSLTLLGSMIGKKFGKSGSGWIERFGGLVLILIGLKIVYEHMN
jgi:putative Mn2+ efflux pump MntP